MRTTDVVIVGAGQAGLALSQCLTTAGIDHVVFERGRIGERWRSAVPTGLRLLTPNWMTRLPGWSYRGPDPDGFMARAELIRYFETYAASFAAPVEEETTVLKAGADGRLFRVDTDRGSWRCRALVVATGHCDRPRGPAMATRLSHRIHAIHAANYRSRASLPPGGVVVVGASSSGVQIADDLACAGRKVILAVGSHTRMPRDYRGEDVFCWMDRAGILIQPIEELSDPQAAANQPSMQLVGRHDRADLDLAVLEGRGVRLMGRLIGVEGGALHFADDLEATTTDAERRLRGLLAKFDAIDPADRSGGGPGAFVRTGGGGTVDLREEGVRSVVFATGYTRVFDWLRLPAVRADGELDHRHGITPVPGLYALGYRMLRRRNSNFIDGVGADAIAIAKHIEAHLAACRRLAA